LEKYIGESGVIRPVFSQGDLIGLVAVYGYVAAVVALSWALRKRIRNARKLVHILTGGIVFFWWMFDSAWVMAGLAALPFVPLLLLATPHSPVKFLKNSLLGARSTEGHAYGLVMYAVSWTIIAYLLFEDLFAASVAIAAMSFGDGMGEVIGRKFGKHRYAYHRTLEGSAAVFVTTLVSILVLSWFYFTLIGYPTDTQPILIYPFAAAVSVLVTVLEAMTPGSVDNLVIPLLIAGYLHTIGA
jgi:phytol kinase